MLAAQSAIAELARRTNNAGSIIILLDRDGTLAFAHNTPRIAYP